MFPKLHNPAREKLIQLVKEVKLGKVSKLALCGLWAFDGDIEKAAKELDIAPIVFKRAWRHAKAAGLFEGELPEQAKAAPPAEETPEK